MTDVEVFLDEMPGETRGMVARGGRFHHLLIHRDSDPAQHRLGARSVGRIAGIEPSLNAAFVDLGADPPFGFLPLGRQSRLTEGQKVEVLVTAEPRERKGPTLKLLGDGAGEPRLVTPGPSVAERLAELVPGAEVLTGVPAIQAAWDAEEEALGGGDFFADSGVDLAVQRTRALIAVDIDYVGAPGRDARRGRASANLIGIQQAARLISLKRWGGLVAIDLVGSGHDGDAITTAARRAFAGDQVAFGPVSRFGVLQLSMPWRETPVEEVLNDGFGRPTVETRALHIVRHLHHAQLSDRSVPQFVARCAPEEAAIAAPLVGRLGPRGLVQADSAIQPGRAVVEAR